MLIYIAKEKLKNAFETAFPSFSSEIEVTRSTHPRFGHYQCNSAMKLNKVLKMPPRDIATAVVNQLQIADQPRTINKCEVVGPGFINLEFSAAFISDYCQRLLVAPQENIKITHPQKMIIDFSSPNTAKEMHVGHLRSTIIGDCLARLFEFLGHTVLRLNHIGDWGTAFGMLIAYLKQYEPAILSGEKEADIPLLVTYYKKAKQCFDDDPLFKKEAQHAVVDLQRGDKKALAAWALICDFSRKSYQEIYDLLDVSLIERGESFYNNVLPQVIADFEGKGLVTLSEGAKCLFLEGFANRDNAPLPFMLQKSDGGYNYATTDLAAIKHRLQIEKADRIIYVTYAGQAMNFAMLFAAARKVGYLPNEVRVDHVPFGLVLGPDGKKIKTRTGETERLIDLLTSAVNKAEKILYQRNQEIQHKLSEEEMTSLSKKLGINAVKYADLVCNRMNDYVFSYDRMLRFEGNTAAFLMYAYVRIQGIKRRVGKEASLSCIQLVDPSEVVLGLHLCQFKEILYSIAEDLLPNRLCDYLYELAEKFNSFFRDCRVEGAKEAPQRLALCELTSWVFEQGLTILGLQTVSRM